MTTVSANFKRTEQLAMPELFVFRIGDVFTRYTSWVVGLTVAGYSYKSVPIKRGIIKQDTQMGKVSVDITCSLIPELTRFAANTPAPPVEVFMRRIVSDDLNVYVDFFSGSIMGTTFKDGICVARCESNSRILNKIVPNWVCKPTCNHKMFDDMCGLDKELYVVNGTISAIDGNVVTVNGLSSQPWEYAGGYVKTDYDYRMITGQEGDDISLHIPFYAMSVGTEVTVLPGCLGSPEICDTIYDNLEHFLGFTSVPQRNPVLYGM